MLIHGSNGQVQFQNIPGSNYPKARQQALNQCWISRWNHRILCLTGCSYYIQVMLTDNFLEYISLSIFTDLRALGAKLRRHTTSTSIRITLGKIITKTSGSFFEGFWIIKGQSHWDPHQDYCWCDALVNIISKTKEVEMNRCYNHI